MKTIASAVIMVGLLCCGTALANIYANDGDKPFAITRIASKGHDIAALYVMPHEKLGVDAEGYPMMGAGYYQALPGEAFPIKCNNLARMPDFEGHVCFPDLDVDQVEWDRDGNLTKIEGLRPAFKNELQPDIAITSDVKNPRIADSNLYIKLAGRGDTEYWVKIQYGQIVAIGKHEAGAGTGTSKPAIADEKPKEIPDGEVSVTVSPKGNCEIAESGGFNGELTKVAISAGRSGKKFELELSTDKMVDGHIQTKQFGVITAAVDGKYWRFSARESQIEKMKAFLKAPPEK